MVLVRSSSRVAIGPSVMRGVTTLSDAFQEFSQNIKTKTLITFAFLGSDNRRLRDETRLGREGGRWVAETDEYGAVMRGRKGLGGLGLREGKGEVVYSHPHHSNCSTTLPAAAPQAWWCRMVVSVVSFPGPQPNLPGGTCAIIYVNKCKIFMLTCPLDNKCSGGCSGNRPAPGVHRAFWTHRQPSVRAICPSAQEGKWAARDREWCSQRSRWSVLGGDCNSRRAQRLRCTVTPCFSF